MILVDMNQISLASVMMHLNITKRHSVEGGMVRHMILNSLRMYRERFFEEYGELVICYDSKHYWRRDIFPQYKAGRKKTRDSSSHDWDDIFEFLNAFKDEMIEFMPYKVLEVYGAEADDIIAWLCRCGEFSEWQKLIISNDRDFIQLCDDKTVLVRPGKNEEVLNKNKILEQYQIHPRNFAWARAITGDKSDNLEGVKGLGLATVAKRFSFLSENKDYGLQDILTHAKNNNSKIKAYQNVLDNEEIIASNYEIMQLYTSTISSQGVQKLKYAVKNDGVTLNRSEIRKMLLKDGIGTLNIDELMLMLNSHQK